MNFEDVCYRCAVLKQPIHNFVRAARYPFDIMVSMLPMESGDERVGCCALNSPREIRQALSAADARMYGDKENLDRKSVV